MIDILFYACWIISSASLSFCMIGMKECLFSTWVVGCWRMKSNCLAKLLYSKEIFYLFLIFFFRNFENFMWFWLFFCKFQIFFFPFFKIFFTIFIFLLRIFLRLRIIFIFTIRLVRYRVHLHLFLINYLFTRRPIDTQITRVTKHTLSRSPFIGMLFTDKF